MPATIQKILKPTKYRAVDTSTSEQLISQDLVTNSSFSGTSNLDGWALSTQSTPSNVSGNMQMNSDGASFSRAKQELTTVIGARYKVSANVVVNGSSNDILIGTSENLGDLLTYRTTGTGEVAQYFVATGTTTYLQVRDGASSSGSTYSYVSVHRVESFGNNNHGQIYSGRGLEFDGVSDYLTTGYGSGLNPYTTPMTVACWVKRSNSEDMIFGPSNGTNQRFYIGIHSSKFDMGIQDSTWNDGTDSGTLPNAEKDTWYRVVVVAKDGVATMYVNGESQFTKNYTSYVFNSNFYIGWHGATDHYRFDGCLSDFQFWESAWTQSDVTFDYLNPESLALNNSGTSLTESNLKLWYPMQDGHRGQQSYILDGANTGLSSVSYYGGSTVAFASWTAGAGWSESNGIITGSSAGSLFRNDSATALVDGVTYKATIVVDSYTSGSVKAYAGGSQVNFGVTTAGTYSVYITNATSNNFAGLNGAAFSGTISSVEFYPINDKHHATTVFLGDEMIKTQANRQFASGGQWVGAGGGSVSLVDDSANDASRDAVLRIDASSTSADRAELPQVNLNETTKAGRTYRIEFLFRYVDNTDMTGNSYVNVGGTLATNLDHTATSWTTYTNDIVATDDSTNIRIYVNGGSGHADNALLIDNVSIKEVGIASGWTDADQQLDIPQTALQSYNQLAWANGTSELGFVDITPTSGLWNTVNGQWNSVSCWFWHDKDNAGFPWWIDSQPGLWLYPDGSDIEIGLNTGNSDIFGVSLPQDNFLGRWTHVVLQFARTDNTGAGGSVGQDDVAITSDYCEMFIDGEKQTLSYVKASNSNAMDPVAGSDLQIMRYNDGTTYSWNGSVTEVAVFTDQLTQAEVSELYNDGKALDATTHSNVSNLTGYWRNNGLATWKDLSANSNDGAVSNFTETLLLPAGVDASRDNQGFLMNKQKTTNALNLPNNNYDAEGYVDLVGARSVAADTAFSMTLWLKPDDIADNRFFGDGNDYIRFRTNDDMRFYFGSSVYDLARNSGNFTKNEWVHIAFVRDTSNLVRMYIDGEVQTSTQTVDAAIDYRYIGANSDSNTFKGQIDDVMIYEGKEMSASEVKRNYNAGKRSHR